LATSVTVTKTNNAEIDGLLGGTKWTGTITYSFPDSPSDYLAGYSSQKEPTTGFSQAPAAEQTAINYAVGLILSYTNASIVYAGTGSANIQIAQSSAANPTSYAYYPSNVSTGTGGDVWFGTDYDYSQAKLGNYYFATALHELGHAFGLKHSQETTGGVAGVAVPAAHDDSEFTVMSYRSYVGGPLTGYTNEDYGFPETYMANDILALQTLYGANFTSHGENTTYSWNQSTGQEFINGVAQPAPGGGAGGSANRVFETVWDGNGIDTYDLSNYSTGVTINLNPGASSITSAAQIAYLGNGHYAQGNVFNAYLFNGDARSYIENAVGGAGNDSLTGNAIGNVLSGGSGDDTLTGLAGNDAIDGGSGTDVAVFSGIRANYLVTWNAAAQTYTVADQRAGSPDGTDALFRVEYFQFADSLFASSAFASAPVNHAPVLTVPAGTVTASAGQFLQASSLFNATDSDGDPLTYFFQDGTAAANSGHFVLNGAALAQGAAFHVDAGQLGLLMFVAGSADDDLSVQVADDKGALSAGAAVHVHFNNHAPLLFVTGVVSAMTGQSLQVSSLFSAVDGDGDPLTYFFQDGTSAAGSGRFVLNGTALAQGAAFHVSAAELAQLSFVTGSVDDNLSMQVADDKGALSAGIGFHVHVDQAPVLTVPASTVTASAGQSLQAFSLFSATDPDGDPLTYFFQDGTSAASSGHFVLNGTALANGAGFHVNGAQLGQLTFVAGTSDDSLSVQLADDKGALSAGVGFQIHVTSGAAGPAGAVVVNNSSVSTFSTVASPEQFRFADGASNNPGGMPDLQLAGTLDGGLHATHDATPAAGASAGAAIANAIIPDLFGDTAALHDLHPSAHLTDYFIV
jgi:hypothetical protein